MATQYRKNILNLTPAELAKLRDAFAKLYDFPPDDYRGFSFLAGLHGHPYWLCPHHLPTFLTWHRAFLFVFEKALQEVVEDTELMLPYWDWTVDDAVADGLPAVLADETYEITDGDTVPNPLHHAIVPFEGDRETTRDVSPPLFLEEAAEQARSSVDLADFGRFQAELESGHDGLHGFVGGDMGQVSFAAFDPIFWFHHCNIDRYWTLWQRANPQSTVPDEVLDMVLPGFNATGRDVADNLALEFDYAASSATTDVGADIDATASLDPIKKRFRLSGTPFRQATLVLTGVQHPKDSLQLRLFFNKPGANADTPTNPENHYAGSRFVFGHGRCTGKDASHCDWRKPRSVADFRQPHHLTPFELRVDITEALTRIVAGKKQVDVSLVLVDTFGDPLSPKALKLDSLSLITRE